MFEDLEMTDHVIVAGLLTRFLVDRTNLDIQPGRTSGLDRRSVEFQPSPLPPVAVSMSVRPKL